MCIRDRSLADQFSLKTAENIAILYGGSCKPENAKDIFSQDDIDGGLIGGAQNILIYATSNRRHLLSRKTGNNSDFMRWEEELDERLSISDRFGISIGFYECDQNLYLEIVRSYVNSFGIKVEKEELNKRALQWQAQRGSRSGRVAKQFIVSLLSNYQ